MADPRITTIPLSGSTHGRGIKVTQTAIGTGDTIHVAYASVLDGEGDKIVLYAINSDTVTRTLTLGWGGTTDPDDLIEKEIPLTPAGTGIYTLVVDGLLLRNGLTVVAAADAANVVVVFGYAIRGQ